MLLGKARTQRLKPRIAQHFLGNAQAIRGISEGHAHTILVHHRKGKQREADGGGNQTKWRSNTIRTCMSHESNRWIEFGEGRHAQIAMAPRARKRWDNEERVKNRR